MKYETVISPGFSPFIVLTFAASICIALVVGGAADKAVNLER